MRHLLPLSLLLALALPGCGVFFGKQRPTVRPAEYTIESPYPEVRTLAIAPAVNLSGSREFDTLVVSDTLYSEMQQVEGLNVLPVNKTLLAMQRLHIRSIDDVKTAQTLAAALHVDGLVVPAVTAYDPYNPPLVGMILQLYTPPAPPQVAVAPSAPAPARPALVQLPPAAMPGKPTALGEAVVSNPAGSTIVADVEVSTPGRGVVETPKPVLMSVPEVHVVAAPLPPPSQPVAQVSAVFNATNQTVLKELDTFAEGRTEYDSALADKQYLVDADSYMRFVAHAMIRRLMDVERARLSDR